MRMGNHDFVFVYIIVKNLKWYSAGLIFVKKYIFKYIPVDSGESGGK